MAEYKRYQKKTVTFMRPVTEDEIAIFHNIGCIPAKGFDVDDDETNVFSNVSISAEDLMAGSPKIGDMIARNPSNYLDQWLVSEKYFKDNFQDAE